MSLKILIVKDSMSATAIKNKLLQMEYMSLYNKISTDPKKDKKNIAYKSSFSYLYNVDDDDKIDLIKRNDIE